ncbi:RICIN domain-containing protein [Micromonospora echinospora]|uniref:RICIN domain-containing protein n=1 Tax=Micromonospora echinospora TaxID=1877 RepID=UPI003A8B061C
MIAALIAATGGVIGAPGTAAAAVPAPDPVAIGQQTPGDLQVLATDTDTAGSLVMVRTYKADLPAAVKSQRWSFEVITPGASPVYRIRHVSSNRCLQSAGAADGAGVVIADCGTSNPQLWTTQTDSLGGFYLKSKRDGRCLDIWASVNGEPAIMYTCSSYFSTQLWRPRTGAAECGERSITALCVTTTQPVFGVMGTWRQQPMSLEINGSTDPYDANTMYNMISWNPLTSAGADPGFDYVEMGWRGRWSAGSTTSHQAYWLEDGIVNEQVIEEYHAINEADSTLPDGSTHTWMALGNSNGQWDVFYDFNPVGTTRLASGSRTREIEYGLLDQDHENSFLATPFENRVQIFDGNSVWRRPRLGETGQIPGNICGLPNPTYTYTEPSTPPYCYTTSLVGRPSSTTGGPPEVDRFVVGKPAVDTLMAATPATSVKEGPAGTHNGVDQRKLAACMATDPTSCLTTVPGLAQCVQARKICNVAGASSRPEGTPVTAEAAREHARRTVKDPTSDTQVNTLNTAAFQTRYGVAPTGIGTTEKLHVVTGRGTVQSLGAHPKRSYSGYTMAYQAQTGRLLYACLGQACSAKEAE